MNKLFFSSPRLLSLLSMVFGVFLGNCGVNSGNPIGNSVTSTSVYIQTASVDSVKSVALRVRGLQLISNERMDVPKAGDMEEISFDSVKVIDLTDTSSGDMIPLLEDKTISYRDYRQVRLLLDTAQPGTVVFTSGESKSVLPLPLDLFVVEQGLEQPQGGFQTDQLAMLSSESIIQKGIKNKFALTVNLSKAMLAPTALSARMKSYFVQEKAMKSEEMDKMMFLQPMQADKPAIVPIKGLGAVGPK